MKHFGLTLFIVMLVLLGGFGSVSALLPALNGIVWVGIVCLVGILLGWCKKHHQYPFHCLVALALCFSGGAKAMDDATLRTQLYADIESAQFDDCPDMKTIEATNSIQNLYRDLNLADVLAYMTHKEHQLDPEETSFDADTYTNMGVLLEKCRKIFVEGSVCSTNTATASAKVVENCSKALECHNAIANIQDRITGDQTATFAFSSNNQRCALCRIGTVVMRAANVVVENSRENFSKKASTVLGICFLIWLCVHVLKLFGQWGMGKNGDFLNELLRRFFIVAIVLIILNTGMGQLYRYWFTPLINITTSLSDKITDLSHETLKNLSIQDFVDKVAQQPNYASVLNLDTYCPACSKSTSSNAYSASMGLSDTAINRIDCMVCRVSRSLHPYQVLGMQMISFANKELKEVQINNDQKIMLPKQMGMWILGAAFVLVFLWIQLIIGFNLVQIFFNFALMALLMPFFVLTFAFPSTRKYTKKGWELFVHTLFEIISLSVGVAMIKAIVFVALPSPVMQDDLAALTATEPWDVYKMFLILTQQLDPTTGKATGDFGAGNYIGLLVCLFLLACTAGLIMKNVRALNQVITRVKLPTSDIADQAQKMVVSGVKMAGNMGVSVKNWLSKP